MNTNSSFIGLYIENPFWYQKFDLRQIRIFRGGQPVLCFYAADGCRFYVTQKKTMNFQVDIVSIPIDKFKDHYVLEVDLTSMQNATENWHYPELVRKALRLELNFIFPLEHVTELILLGERMSSVAVDKFGSLEKVSEIDMISLHQTINRIPPLKYRYRDCFWPDYVPTPDKDFFAIINTQRSKTQGEFWIMIANIRQILFYLQTLLHVKKQFPQAAIWTDDARMTTVPTQRLRFLHNLCSFSSLRILTRINYRKSRR